MSDTYQATYDAVRSKVYNGDVGGAVAEVLREANISHYATVINENVRAMLANYERPSAVYRPSLMPDGNQWCALYGTNLQEGVAGFGGSPEEAMGAFDVAWYAQIKAGGGK